MRTARLLTVSHSNPLGGLPPDADPTCMETPLWMQTPPPEADPLVMWPVMHAGKPPPTREQNDRQV